jgi:hypothetical protein
MVLDQLTMYGRDSLCCGRRDQPTSGGAYEPRPRAADADIDDRLRPMMTESAMLPDKRYHYPDRCLPQDGDGHGSDTDTDTDLGMPMRCTGEG